MLAMSESQAFCSSTCLGLPEWTDCCSENCFKKPGTSAAHEADRFEYVGDQEAKQLAVGFTPKNTEVNTKWAVTNFQEWCEWRNSKYPDEPVPENFLEAADSDLLDKWLSRYVVETRGKKGKVYVPSTLHQLLCGLYRHMKTTRADCPNFVDKKSTRFRQLHGTLDSRFRQLHESGIGRHVKHAEVITSEEEEKLWSSGQLGTKTPRALQNAVFYYNGKNFCIRGGEKHRNLKVSQMQRQYNPDRYVYHEYVSKNRLGTFKKHHISSKVVPIHCQCARGTRCHVHLLDFYLSKLPPEALAKDLFYVRPLEVLPANVNAPWYSTTPVGSCTLSKKVKDMCQKAGVQGHKTNHSLRATGASSMYEAEVPETLIQERTGHRSLQALRVYERSTEKQHQAVSAVLSSTSHASFHTEMSRTFIVLLQMVLPASVLATYTAVQST